jgi:tellurite resistance protein
MDVTPTKKPTFLEFFPLTLFAAVSSLSSLSAAWGLTGWPVGAQLKGLLGMTSTGIFVIVSVIYALKWRRYPGIIKHDFEDPIAMNLFGVFFISLLIISGFLYNYNPQLGFVIWVAGTVAISIFSWIVLSRWFGHPQNPQNALPVWLVPLIGILDVPLTGLRYTSPDIRELCLFFFVTSLLFIAILIVVIFTRLLFQAELASPMYPTLLLLSVPFSMTYAIYDTMTGGRADVTGGGADLIGAFLFYGALFMAAVFGRKIFFCMLRFQFSVSFWTVSFPLAALTVAAFRYAHHSTILFVKVIPFLLLAGTSVIVIALFYQTFHFIIAEYIISGCPKPKPRMTYREFIHRSQAQQKPAA